LFGLAAEAGGAIWLRFLYHHCFENIPERSRTKIPLLAKVHRFPDAIIDKR
jgi:hypothetical protein